MTGHVMSDCLDPETGRIVSDAVGHYFDYLLESYRNIILWYNSVTNKLENGDGLIVVNPFEYITPTQLKAFITSGKTSITHTIKKAMCYDFVFIRDIADGTEHIDVDWWDGGDVTIQRKDDENV